MSFIEILLISISLAMDAFAVAICNGLTIKDINWKKANTVGLYFGTFQALMPIIGYYIASTFEQAITSIDHWISFILLSSIGINMIKEAYESKNNKNINNKEQLEKESNKDAKTMIILAISTSIDALAVGITFACLRIKITILSISAGIITFILSVIGVKIGNKFGDKFEYKAESLGGIVLILLGIKILLEHLDIITLF